MNYFQNGDRAGRIENAT